MKSLWSFSSIYRQKNSVNVDFLYELVCTLRYSFATYCLEQGTDLRYIQKLLGHNNVKTTERYTYVSKKHLQNIKSPLDRIVERKKLKINKLNKSIVKNI